MKWEWLEPRKKGQTVLSILSKSPEALSFRSPSPWDIHTHLRSGLQRHALGRWSPLQSRGPIKQDPKTCRFSLSTNTRTRKRKRVRRGKYWRRKKAMQQYPICFERRKNPHLFGGITRATWLLLSEGFRACATDDLYHTVPMHSPCFFTSNEARRPHYDRVCREPRGLKIQAGTRVVSSFHALEAFYAALTGLMPL